MQKLSFDHDNATESAPGTALIPAIGSTATSWVVVVVSSIIPARSALMLKGPVTAVMIVPPAGTAISRSWVKLPSALTVNVGQDRLTILSPARASDSVPYIVVRSCEPALATTLTRVCRPSESQSVNRFSSASPTGAKQAVSSTPSWPTKSLVQLTPSTVKWCVPPFSNSVTSALRSAAVD